MAITSSYPIATPTATDTLVGTKFIENKEPTTNSFNIGDLANFIAGYITVTPITLGVANGLSLSGATLSLGLASGSANGALSSANWTTFNNKQNALSGTGFIKASGSTISYDNSTYTPTSRTLTINGTTYDLSADRSWTVGGTTLTLTTTGTSGPATLIGDVLNIPQYSGGGTGSLEFNSTDLTVWNNGKGNIATNTSFGDSSLRSNTTGSDNTCYGQNAGYFNTTGTQNTFIGRQAGQNNTIGTANVGLGYGAGGATTTGDQNTSVGSQAGGSVVTGGANVFLGRSAGYAANGASSGNVIIGSNAGPTSAAEYNNKLYISNNSGTPLIGGDFSDKTIVIDGTITATQFKLSALNTAPASSAAAGIIGEIRYDANYMYVCVATNTWKRSALITW